MHPIPNLPTHPWGADSWFSMEHGCWPRGVNPWRFWQNFQKKNPHGIKTMLVSVVGRETRRGGAWDAPYMGQCPILIIRQISWNFPSCSLPAATKLGQGNIFTSVCQEFVHLLDQVPQNRYTPPQDQVHLPRPGTPPDQVPPPRSGTPPRPGTPPPGPGTIPPPPQIRTTSGRCASYWNAFLFKV